MNSIQSDTLEPTCDELEPLSRLQKLPGWSRFTGW